jgi:hypothetical protein
MANLNLPMAYQELCKSYQGIEDFRTKLLGFLPLATGAGIFFAAKDKLVLDHAHPIAVFGFLITLGLFSFEIYGIRKCHALIQRGKQIERELHTEGQFIGRPQRVLWVINEPFAAALIYPAVMTSWAFLWFAPLYRCDGCHPATPVVASVCVFGAFFLFVLGYDRCLGRKGKKKCDGCLGSFEEGEGTQIRINSLTIYRDYWLCDRCNDALSSWFTVWQIAQSKRQR